MDTGSGRIFNSEQLKMADIKGKLVPWEVGESIIIKDCAFTVKEIKVDPVNEIVLKGKASIASNEVRIFEETMLVKAEPNEPFYKKFLEKKK